MIEYTAGRCSLGGGCEIRNVPTAVDRTVSPTKIPRFYSYQYQYALSMVFAVLHCITTSGSYSLQNQVTEVVYY